VSDPHPNEQSSREPVSTTDEDRTRRVQQFVRDAIRLLNRYRDITEGDLEHALKEISVGRTRGQSQALHSRSSLDPTHEKSPPSPVDLEALRKLDRPQLAAFLDRRDVFPNVESLRMVARALGLRGTSRASTTLLKSRILEVLHDRPRERDHMLAYFDQAQAHSDEKH
jgi:hypothetical protein